MYQQVDTPDERQLNIGLIGYGTMGKAHSLGYRNVSLFFEDVKVTPHLLVLCGRNEAKVAFAAAHYGWDYYTTDWREVVRDPQVNLVDICTPDHLHSEIAIAAAEEGKDIVCEKPLARNVIEGKRMLEATRKNDVRGIVAYTYRVVPAIQLAKQMVEEGELGEIYHFRASWLSDWAASPDVPFVWRFDGGVVSSGALGDIGSHIVDLAHYLVGEITEVTGYDKTFVKERRGHTGESKQVEVDDAAFFLAKYKNGVIGTFEVTRSALGNKEVFSFEINGSKGSVAFNSKQYNELQFFDFKEHSRIQGVRTIYVGNKYHPYGETPWPYGEVIGYSDLFGYQAYEILKAVAEKSEIAATFEEALQVQAVIDAVLMSKREGRWVRIDEILESGG